MSGNAKDNMEGRGMQYGFYGRLKADFPSQIIVDVTELCNLQCIHCGHPDFKKSPHYKGRNLSPQLNAKLVDEVRKHGQGLTQYIRYTSEGEPLLHKGIYEMLAYAAENSGVFIALTTNGTRFDDVSIGQLLDTGISLIDISIDAYLPETYATIRVKGDLEVTRNNVINLIKAKQDRRKDTKIVVSFIEQPQNTDEVEDFELFWKDQGADQVVVRRLHSNAGALVSLAKDLREHTVESRRPCLYPWDRVTLNPRGYLAFCPTDWSNGSIIRNADYRNTTIKDIWQGEFYRGLRAAHLSNEFTGYEFCGQCPDWSQTRWPEKGRSYANMIEEFTSSNEDQG